ncbi:MAG TPA: HAD family hydrolase [Pyrinomonadaceae bacterium]|nr:HAD family hydrolase [Pyrinomonadaceae bacterium]
MTEKEAMNQFSDVLQKTAFIDRDGTLIEEVNFLSKVEDLRIFPHTNEALALLRESGYRIFVVTNQSGIGRGIYTEDDMHRIHRVMAETLQGLIDGYFFCPHLPDAGCLCRKPRTGMLESAAGGFAVDRERSWMIGDKQLDIDTGINAGIRTALVKTGYGTKTAMGQGRQADVVGEDLLDAVRQILGS